MRLTYRGADYESSPLEVRETDIYRRHQQPRQYCRTLQESGLPLSYRGIRYTTDSVATALSSPALRTAQTLSYRGVKYVRKTDGSTGLVASSVVTVPNTTMAALRELSRVHQENLRQNLARRLQTARARGDQELVKLLEAESEALAL